MTTHFVTGAAGFIGSHLCESLLNQGFDVVALDNMNTYYDPDIKQQNLLAIEKVAHAKGREFSFYMGDIRHQDKVAQIFKQHSIDTVFHLAAMAGVRPSLQNPRLYVDVNELGTINLLEEAKNAEIKKFVFASSSSVYGNQVKTPFAESDNVDHPISVYAATKKAGELLCHNYHKIYDLSIACLRFFTVYGPRQRPDLAIRKFTDAILNNNPVTIYGDGSKSRDYTYIADIVQGICLSADWLSKHTSPVYDVFNLGESKTISVLDMVKAIEVVVGKKAVLDFQSAVAGDVEKTFADISKAKSVLGYNPATNFSDGLQKFVEWYQKRTPSSHAA